MKYDPNKHHRHSIRLKKYDYSQAGLYFVTICIQNRQCLLGNIKDDKMILNQCGKIVNDEWQNLIIKYPNTKLHEYITMPNHFHAIFEIINAITVPKTTIVSIPTIVGAGSTCPLSSKIRTNSISQINKNANADNVVEHDTNNITEYVNGDVERIGNLGQMGEGKGQVDPAPTAVLTVTSATDVAVGNIVGYFKYQTTKKIGLSVKLWQRNYYEHIVRDEQSYKNISQYIVNNPKNWQKDKFYKSGGK